MEGRPLARSAGVEELRREPGLIHEMGHEPAPGLSLYPPHPSHTYAWGMAIDLSSCVGCNACVVACQAENNVPVVGKDQVAARPRDALAPHRPLLPTAIPANPRHVVPARPCVHCENAPCELVCPVAATVHSAEGLNDMVYNRCVGTRYCRTTVRTRCGASTSSTTRRSTARPPCACSRTPTSPSGGAA